MHSRDLEAFEGFRTVAQLTSERCASVPARPGVYIVVTDARAPAFLEIGTGGHFKDRDPNVGLQVLQDNWVPGTDILYIGKAGGGTSGSTLKKRLWQYLRFGRGEKVGHWGGRYIWQLGNAAELRIGWAGIADARAAEADLIRRFVGAHGKRPFANLQD